MLPIHPRPMVDASALLWSNAAMQRGRVLALDYGTKNIGLACCDELGITIRPLPAVQARNRHDLMARLHTCIRENDIREIVIGLPLNMDGTSGDAARRVERFMIRLRAEFDLPLTCVDERLSTVEALELWKDLNPRQQKRYRTIDSLAAVLILDRYLKG